MIRNSSIRYLLFLSFILSVDRNIVHAFHISHKSRHHFSSPVSSTSSPSLQLSSSKTGTTEIATESSSTIDETRESISSLYETIFSSEDDYTLSLSSTVLAHYVVPPPIVKEENENEIDEQYRWYNGDKRWQQSLNNNENENVLPPSGTFLSTLQKSNNHRHHILRTVIPNTVFPFSETADGRIDEVIDNKEKKEQKKKKVVIYIPGLDGSGVSASQQFNDLSKNFEFWRLTVDANDRTSFSELVTMISSFVEDLTYGEDDGGDGGSEILLIGESAGGMIAPAVAMNVQGRFERRMKEQRKTETMTPQSSSPLLGMVLVNPATSYSRSPLENLIAPFLTSLNDSNKNDINGGIENNSPSLYSIFGAATLSSLIPDTTQLKSIGSIILQTIQSSSSTQLSPQALFDGLGLLEKRLPLKTVEHRCKNWLSVGMNVVVDSERLSLLNISTLVVAGEDDNLLPSKDEAKRLERIMPNCRSVIVKGSGHFVLDDRINITDLISRDPRTDPIGLVHQASEKAKSYDPIKDWMKPDISAGIGDTSGTPPVKILRELTSPVFFSTGKDGKRVNGLGLVPSPSDGAKDGDGLRPVLFVANHQLLGLDLSLIIAELLEEREMAVRGLAHPVIFETVNGADGSDGGGGGGSGGQASTFPPPLPGTLSTFERFGAVKVTPRNYYRLMQTNQSALLFPGGVREVFHGKDEAYQLFWPGDKDDTVDRDATFAKGKEKKKVDFVRTAARFNATIVPLSSIGVADSFNIFLDGPEILNLPFGIGDRALNATLNIGAARFNDLPSDEVFLPPVTLPRLAPPARMYALFGKPMDTTSLDHRDINACQEFYGEVRSELANGIQDLIQARENDPYGGAGDWDDARRITYERIISRGKIVRAPTFGVNDLGRTSKKQT